MDQADNQGNPGQGQGTAPGQEHFIPKHRFDELQARLREAQEREALKDRMYMEREQAMRSQRQPEPEPELSAEELGVDPQTAKAIMKVADRVAERKVKQRDAQYNQILGQMGNDLEAAKFLAKHGGDKAKYMDQIKAEQQKYAQNTGQYMDPETAYKLVRFDEMQALEMRRQSQPAAPAANTPAPPAHNTPAPSAPNAANTRAQSTPAGAVDSNEPDLGDLEARLSEGFGSGFTI